MNGRILARSGSVWHSANYMLSKSVHMEIRGQGNNKSKKYMDMLHVRLR